MLGKKIEPLDISEILRAGKQFEGEEYTMQIRLAIESLFAKINENIQDYMQFKDIIEQKINQIQIDMTTTNMHLAKIAGASGDKSLIEADYERPPVDDFEKEFGKMQTTDSKAGLEPIKTPKFEGEDPFGSS